jgi:hypothetical protein
MCRSCNGKHLQVAIRTVYIGWTTWTTPLCRYWTIGFIIKIFIRNLNVKSNFVLNNFVGDHISLRFLLVCKGVTLFTTDSLHVYVLLAWAGIHESLTAWAQTGVLCLLYSNQCRQWYNSNTVLTQPTFHTCPCSSIKMDTHLQVSTNTKGLVGWNCRSSGHPVPLLS